MLSLVCIIFSTITVTLGVPVSGVPGVVTSEKFNQSLVLDAAGSYILFWNYNATDITFEVHVKTKGWVGFGFSGNGNMFPGDVVVGWVTADGRAHFQDRHTVGHSMPIQDKSQDWHLLMAKENEFGTVIKFTRKIDTCDSAEDRVIEEGTVRLIYAYSPIDPASDDAIMYHGTTRGTKSVSLLSQMQVPTDLPDDVIYYDFLNTNFVIPSNDTTYWCRGFQMEDIGKHHMIKYEAVVTPGNENHVHHAVLYRCPAGPVHGANGECYGGKRPKDLPQCYNMVLLWAVGGEAFYFPDHVGLSVGGPGDNTFYVIEIHYDNPNMVSGIIDNSGFRVTLTKNLRQHEAGLIEIGSNVNINTVIPPYQEAHMTKGYCTEKCVRASFYKSGLSEVKMFGGFQHSHLLGVGIKTKHFRNGTELRPLLNDPNYDFNFQQSYVLPEEVKVYPGDSFSVECTHDSRNRHGPTFGGLSTRDEMCVTIMYYYPRMPLEFCLSEPIFDLYHEPDSYMLYKKFVDADWTNKTVQEEFKTNLENSQTYHLCFGDNFYGPAEYFVEKETSNPYVPPPTTCN